MPAPEETSERDAAPRIRVRVPVPLGQIEDVFYLAICHDCGRGGDGEPVKVPFLAAADRDEWANAHKTTGHLVVREVELRGPASA